MYAIQFAHKKTRANKTGKKKLFLLAPMPSPGTPVCFVFRAAVLLHDDKKGGILPNPVVVWAEIRREYCKKVVYKIKIEDSDEAE